MSKESWLIKFHSFGKKLTAIAFIFLILIGNVWVSYRFTGKPLPGWTVLTFQLGLVLALLGFILMVPSWVNPPEVEDEVSQNSQNDKHQG